MLHHVLICTLLLSFSLFSMEDESKIINHIFIEIDDVIFEPNPASGLALLGSAVQKLTSKWTIDSMNKKLIEIIAVLDSDLSDEEKQAAVKQAVFRGEKLPHIWGHYLMGKKTGDQMITLAKTKASETLGFLEKPAVNYALSVSFTPEKEASLLAPKPEVVEILKKLAQQPHNRLYIFSNKRAETVEHLRRYHPALFELFENRIHVSGQTQTLKPNTNAYTTLLETLKINPENCYALEWETAYQEAASQHGLHAIAFQNNIDLLKTFLREKALLPAE